MDTDIDPWKSVCEAVGMAEIEMTYAEFKGLIAESYKSGFALASATAAEEIERLEAEVDALQEQIDHA